MFKFDKPENSPGFLLWQTSILWHRGISKVLVKFDLTHPQFVLLASMLWFSLNQKATTQILLATHAKMDPMTTSSVLRTLERKAYVTRKHTPTDSRAKVILLTDKGELTIKNAISTVEAYDISFFKKIGERSNDLNSILLQLIE